MSRLLATATFLATTWITVLGFGQTSLRNDPESGSVLRTDPEATIQLRNDPEVGQGGYYHIYPGPEGGYGNYFAAGGGVRVQREGSAGARADVGAATPEGASNRDLANMAMLSQPEEIALPIGVFQDPNSRQLTIDPETGQPTILRRPGDLVADKIRRRPLIQVKVRVIEVDRSDTLGAASVLDFIARESPSASLITGNNINNDRQNLSGGSTFDIPGLIGLNPAGTAIGAGTGMLINLTTDRINLITSLLATEFNGDVITAPQVTTLDGELVVFNEGDKIPFELGANFVQDGTNTVQQFFYKHVGTYVAVVPKIVYADVGEAERKSHQDECGWYHTECTIDLDIIVRLSGEGDKNVSAIDADGNVTIFPVTAERDVRAISNTVQIKSGNGLVIGGLLSMRDEENISKTPVLGDLPWVGALFRSKSNLRRKTETLIFVEAEVLPPLDAYDEVGCNLVAAKTAADFCNGQQHLRGPLCDTDLYYGMHAAGLTGDYLPLPSHHEVEYWKFYNQASRHVRHHRVKTQIHDLVR